MKLEIITPDATVFDGEATLVQLPGYDGSFEILKNHAPMISILKKGTIKIKEENNNVKNIEINGGVLEVHENKILVLAE